MVLSLKVKTNIPRLYIDYIEVQAPQLDGETVSLNWEESEYTHDRGEFTALFKGICFGEDDADGRLSELENFKITKIGIYYDGLDPRNPSNPSIVVTEMTLEDGDATTYEPDFLPFQVSEELCDYTG